MAKKLVSLFTSRKRLSPVQIELTYLLDAITATNAYLDIYLAPAGNYSNKVKSSNSDAVQSHNIWNLFRLSIVATV